MLEIVDPETKGTQLNGIVGSGTGRVKSIIRVTSACDTPFGDLV